MTVIVMTREMGTLGKDVALQLSVEMGLGLIHHQLAEQDIAKRLSIDAGDVHRFLEGSPSLLDRWKIDENRLSQYTREEILKLAQKGNVLIRGWGATYLLEDVPHVIRVRVCAPMDFRIKNMMERLQISDPAVAQREIERNDAAHTRVMHHFFDRDWQNPLYYHLVLNTGCLPVSACVDQVRLLADNPAFRQTEQSRNVLADKLIENQIRVAFEEDEKYGLGGRSIDVTVVSGKVTLSGITGMTSDIRAAEKIARQVKGVTSVENEIVNLEMPYMG